jgi:hypothetical protein
VIRKSHTVYINTNLWSDWKFFKLRTSSSVTTWIENILASSFKTAQSTVFIYLFVYLIVFTFIHMCPVHCWIPSEVASLSSFSEGGSDVDSGLVIWYLALWVRQPGKRETGPWVRKSSLMPQNLQKGQLPDCRPGCSDDNLLPTSMSQLPHSLFNSWLLSTQGVHWPIPRDFCTGSGIEGSTSRVNSVGCLEDVMLHSW